MDELGWESLSNMHKYYASSLRFATKVKDLCYLWSLFGSQLVLKNLYLLIYSYYFRHLLQISTMLADPFVPIFTFNYSKCNNYVILHVLISDITFFLLYIEDWTFGKWRLTWWIKCTSWLSFAPSFYQGYINFSLQFWNCIDIYFLCVVLNCLGAEYF